jgi:hypothetical protein
MLVSPDQTAAISAARTRNELITTKSSPRIELGGVVSAQAQGNNMHFGRFQSSLRLQSPFKNS